MSIDTKGGKCAFAAPAYVLSEIEKSGHAQD
jgi:hypothetical protein